MPARIIPAPLAVALRREPDLRAGACFRVPLVSTEIAVAYINDSGPRRGAAGRRTRVVRRFRRLIVTALDSVAAVAKLETLYPGSEIGTPEFIHAGRHTGISATSLARAGFR